jgi:hypothetical protein
LKAWKPFWCGKLIFSPSIMLIFFISRSRTNVTIKRESVFNFLPRQRGARTFHSRADNFSHFVKVLPGRLLNLGQVYIYLARLKRQPTPPDFLRAEFILGLISLFVKFSTLSGINLANAGRAIFAFLRNQISNIAAHKGRYAVTCGI